MSYEFYEVLSIVRLGAKRLLQIDGKRNMGQNLLHKDARKQRENMCIIASRIPTNRLEKLEKIKPYPFSASERKTEQLGCIQ